MGPGSLFLQATSRRLQSRVEKETGSRGQRSYWQGLGLEGAHFVGTTSPPSTYGSKQSAGHGTLGPSPSFVASYVTLERSAILSGSQCF